MFQDKLHEVSILNNILFRLYVLSVILQTAHDLGSIYNDWIGTDPVASFCCVKIIPWSCGPLTALASLFTIPHFLSPITSVAIF